MTEKLLQIHLKAKGMSQRGVRLRILGYSEVCQCQNDAAKMVGKDAAFTEFRNAYHAEALRRFIAEVSEPEEQLTEVTKWRKVSAADLTNPTGPLYLETLFSVRELAVLEQIFRTEHEVTQEELDIITGKAQPAR